MKVNFAGNELDLPNWIAVIGGFFILVCVITAVYNEITLDEDLSNTDRWRKVQDSFEKELKEINTPSKTALNRSENMSKLRRSVFVKNRYRTELSKNEFVNSITEELSKKGWIYYDKNESNSEFYFCREKFDAVLVSQGNGGIFGDGGNYYQLELILGLGVRNRSQNLPKSCK